MTAGNPAGLVAIGPGRHFDVGMPPANSPRPGVLPTVLAAAAALAAVKVGLMLLWFVIQLPPRHAHFERRDTPVADSTILESSVTPDGLARKLVEVEAESGLRVRFQLIRRADSDEALPLVILLAGQRTGSQAIGLIGDPGNINVAALDYPYDGPEKIRGVGGGLSAIRNIRRALLDTPPAVSVALEWMLNHPWVDSEQVELVGASLGVPFAAVAGARDPRFRRVWLLHGGADNREWIGSTLRKRIPNERTRQAAAFGIHVIAHGTSFNTPEWVAAIAPRPVVVIGAAEDESLTHENIRRLQTAAGDAGELLWTEGGHVKPSRPDIIQALLGMVRERIQTDAG